MVKWLWCIYSYDPQERIFSRSIDHSLLLRKLAWVMVGLLRQWELELSNWVAMQFKVSNSKTAVIYIQCVACSKVGLQFILRKSSGEKREHNQVWSIAVLDQRIKRNSWQNGLLRGKVVPFKVWNCSWQRNCIDDVRWFIDIDLWHQRLCHLNQQQC